MLEAHRVLVSETPEATWSFLADKGLYARPCGDAAPCAAAHGEISGLYADGFYVAWMRYGQTLRIDAPADRDEYTLSIPLHGTAAASRASGEFVDCTRLRTTITSPGAPSSSIVSARAERLSLSVREEVLRRHLSMLVGEPISGRIEFAADLDLGTGPGSVVAHGMRMITRAADEGIDVLADARRTAHFEEMALSALLLYQPHSHTSRLQAPATSPAPRDVRRAVDYIEAHHDRPIRLEDLVAVAGVPGRTLCDHFRAFTGQSPLAYLRRTRLVAVRAALEAGTADRVTDAALAAGFAHLGRFAAAYRDAFGEAPSETLARSRGVGTN